MKFHRVYIKAENLTHDRNLLCHGSYHDDSTILALKQSSRFSPCFSSPNCNRHLQMFNCFIISLGVIMIY